MRVPLVKSLNEFQILWAWYLRYDNVRLQSPDGWKGDGRVIGLAADGQTGRLLEPLCYRQANG
jgi:hypothetical protein